MLRSKAEYNKRCIYYKSKKTISKIEMDDKIAGIFYAKYQAINKNSQNTGSIRNINKMVMLETPDNIKGLEIDDFVILDGNKYRVEGIDDIPFSQGRFKYSITLLGEVD